MVDSIFIKITESPCHNISIREIPGLCLDGVFDLTPYLYVDGVLATPSQIADMTFTDKSYLPNQSLGGNFNPSTMDVSSMYVAGTNYPAIDITYAPNVALAPTTVCQKYSHLFNTRIPTKFYITNLILVNDDYGNSRNYTIDGTYYSFNNVFHKNVLNKLYIDNFNFFSGTVLDVYTDNTLTNLVSSPDLTPGDYYVKATNPACSNDQSVFNIHVQERDYDINWQSAPALGTGYYTFSAPSYANATYGWFVWGGNIVSGLNTNQITVYFSQNAAPSITVSCTITLPTIRTNTSNVLNSAVYLTPDGGGSLEEIPQGVTTGVSSASTMENATIFPNPSEGSFVISGNGVYEVKVYNTMGEQVYENSSYAANSPLNVNSKGVHFVQLAQNGKRMMLKVVIQ